MLAYCLYPKVVKDYCEHRKEYGYIMRMGSHVFFNGMALGETNKINIEDGKTLVIKYLGLGDSTTTARATSSSSSTASAARSRCPTHARADDPSGNAGRPEDKSQIGASIPGMVSKVNVKPGDTVEENQVLAIIEAMKMETSITAPKAGKITEVRVDPGQSVKAKELLFVIE